jgi:hypothetical protein
VASQSNRPGAEDPQGRDPLDDAAAPEGADPRTDTDARKTLERILSELLRKGFEASRGPLEKVSESFLPLPRDIAAHLVGGLGDLRSAVVRAVAQEVGRFLREADFASELRRVLNGVDIEASVRVGFKVNEQGALRSDVDVGVDVGGANKQPDKNTERRKR